LLEPAKRGFTLGTYGNSHAHPGTAFGAATCRGRFPFRRSNFPRRSLPHHPGQEPMTALWAFNPGADLVFRDLQGGPTFWAILDGCHNSIPQGS
jgi:hypothetical protein